MRKGLYRLSLNGMGECARTLDLAGDGAPYLDRATYDYLGFEPAFERLPTKREYFDQPHLSPRTESIYEKFWSSDVDERHI